MRGEPCLTRGRVLETLNQVRDPEVGLSIVGLNLVDEVIVANGQVKVRFHLTTPFCPAKFAASIAEDIKCRVSRIPGVTSVEAELLRHYSAGEINERVNGVAGNPPWRFLSNVLRVSYKGNVFLCKAIAEAQGN